MLSRRRFVAFLIACAQIVVLAPATFRAQPALAAPICASTAGKDGSPGTLSGVYDTYYSPPSGTLAAGATTVSLGTIDTGGGGASTAVAAGDLLLIIQMQDGTISTSNSSAYGDGASGSGYQTLGQAGLYEYVGVQSVTGTTATIEGAGSGNGLINTYVKSAGNAGQGQQTYQIVRVPQYVSATLSSTFHAAYWDGKTGGVAALDIATTLNLGGATIYATGNGFRGGGVSVASTTPTSVLNSDWTDSSQMNGAGNAPGFGSKGEGVAGTPDYLFYYTSFTTPSTPASPTVTHGTADGYPGGDMGKGAPANAGGGGNDMDPVANDQNSGGGGGGNGGAGGNGGYPWTPNYSGNTSEYSQSSPGLHTAANYSTTNTGDIGGRGAAALTPSVTRVFMGGGGGAGTNNNGSNNNSVGNYGSSGGVGGGIVMMRIADTSGTAATVYADGTTGLAPDNDGGGGGGAGGTVEITSPNTFTGITVHADGAAGTTAADTSSDTTYAIQHGPGGGGGGGTVLTSSSVTATVAGGANGTTTTMADSYGATAGTAGSAQIVSAAQIPGVASGAECYTAGSTGTVPYIGPPGTGNYDATGSYDGNVAVNNNNDFTAVGFFPTGATLTNSGTVAGSPIGNTITQGPTTFVVQNDLEYDNTTNATVDVTVTGTAPTVPSGWTVRICGAVTGTTCGTGTDFTNGVAGATSTGTYAVPRRTNGQITVYAVYSAPADVVAFSRYDAVIAASQGTNINYTHNELYPGYIVLTKNETIQSSGCSGSPPAGTVCPGGIVLYTIDYRNVIAGGSSESTIAGAYPTTTAGSFTITENGTATWGVNSNGLNEALVAGATCSGTSYGDTTAGSTFTGGTAGSKSFTVTIGGTTGKIVPSGATGTSQGTICFRVKVK
ncbi:MAG TPA: hypothetical protein VMD91_05675 [Candidatus Sulfotelmatobacter sp.]|nr:hypothetical protein [Candidatus Sulfotelmatobacter sp.]